MIKNYILNWKNHPVNSDGMILTRTTIKCDENIFLSVLKRMPTGDYELVDNLDAKEVDAEIFRHLISARQTQKSAQNKHSSLGSIANLPNIRIHSGNAGAVAGGAIIGSAGSSSGMVANLPYIKQMDSATSDTVKYTHFYVFANTGDDTSYVREDGYKIPIRIILLDDALAE